MIAYVLNRLFTSLEALMGGGSPSLSGVWERIKHAICPERQRLVEGKPSYSIIPVAVKSQK